MTCQKLKIILDEKLPNPSKWDVKEFSHYFNKEEKSVKRINFLDAYYFEFRELTDYDKKFDIKIINEFENNIHKRALEDSQKLGINFNKELDLKELKKLKEDFYSKIENISPKEKRNKIWEYSEKLKKIYIKMFRNSLFLDLTNESFLPKILKYFILLFRYLKM